MAAPLIPAVAAGAGLAGRGAVAQANKALVDAAISMAATAALDKAMQVGYSFLNPMPGTPIADLATPDIVNNISIVNNANNDLNAAGEAQAAVNELAGRGNAAFDSLKAKLEAENYGKPTDYLQGRLGSLTDQEIQFLKQKCVDTEFPQDQLMPAAKNNFNKAQRKSTDGVFVSREHHEFLYCLKSGQILAIFALSILQAPQDLLYGAFVTAKKMRKAIETYRKLRRIAFSKNSKELTDLLGTTREQLFADLLNDPALGQTWTDAAQEFIDATP